MSLSDHVDLERHPLGDVAYQRRCRDRLVADSVLVLEGFLDRASVTRLADEANAHHHLAYYSSDTHGVYLEPADASLPSSDARSRQIVSTKGAVTTDLVPAESGLRSIYDDATFREFLCQVLGETTLYEYADPLSSININYYDTGQELGWHFDNSAFSVTLLLQQSESGGVFESIDSMRDADAGDNNELGVAVALDGDGDRRPLALRQKPGDLVLFRGRDALHHVTPVTGERSRILVVFAYNTEPGLSLSENARLTFFGRLG